jgi:hypothetical protein
MKHDRLFGFESDFVDRLQCIPMAVRFKLDRAGIKLTLKQWAQFTAADRRALLERPCDGDDAVDAYRVCLNELVALRAAQTARPLATPADVTWDQSDAAPPAVLAFARSQGIAPPSIMQWRALDALERFVLVKLSRDNHDNVNFVPAMREFGLISPKPG